MTNKQTTSLGESLLQARPRDLAGLRSAAGLLDALRSDPDNLHPLLELQRLLLARVCGRERHIARLRLGSLSGKASATARPACTKARTTSSIYFTTRITR